VGDGYHFDISLDNQLGLYKIAHMAFDGLQMPCVRFFDPSLLLVLPVVVGRGPQNERRHRPVFNVREDIEPALIIQFTAAFDDHTCVFRSKTALPRVMKNG